MKNFRTAAAALAVGFVVAAAASPAFAASTKRTVHPGHAARAQAIGSDVGRRPANDRESIMRECNTKAEGLKNYTWGVQQTYAYNSCMAEHGQPQ